VPHSVHNDFLTGGDRQQRKAGQYVPSTGYKLRKAIYGCRIYYRWM